MMWFLVLSLLTGALELGTLFLACAGGGQGWQLFVLPLCYQLGNLLFLPGAVTPRRARLLGAAGLALLAVGMFFPSGALVMGEVLLASLCMQAARAAGKADCPVWLKRSFRIGGFLLSPVTARFPALVLAVCLGASMLALQKTPQPAPRRAESGRLAPVMVFHQMHYFVYAYAMPAWVFVRSGSAALGAAAFAATWVVYLIPQVAAERVGNVPPRKMFFACHTFLALTMAVMCLSASVGGGAALCTAWVLTGLGGGSVFCIRGLTPACRETDLTWSENVGHVLGAAAAMAIAWAAGEAMLPALTGASCLFVALTLACGAGMVRKEAC